MSEEIRVLKEQLFLATRRQFGSQCEAFSPDQLRLLETDDVEIVVTEDKDDKPEAPATTPKPRTARQAVVISKQTPVKRIELDLGDADKQCDCCGMPCIK